MDHFAYRNGVLSAEDVPLPHIADAVQTPFYCYSTATLERHYTVFADAFADVDAVVCYAVKALSNVAVLRTLANRGAGADVVSGGELQRALLAGMDPQRIVFSGVGKTEAEMAHALEAGILQINVESEPELDQLARVARDKGVSAPVALRLNPDIDAGTHAKITTGKRENKFGIEWTRAHEVYTRAAATDGIRVCGVAVHIGSQLTSLKPFHDAFVRVRDVVGMLRADGISIDNVDLGGGLGVPYSRDDTPLPSEYAATVKDALGGLSCRLIFEPGRVIAGNAGVLVTRVLYVKEGATRTFAIVDAAMNDLARPALYDAHHDIVPVAEPQAGTATVPIDVVGPVCESGDTFARQRALAPLKAGDLVAIRTAGAYGAVMASTYNTRPLVPEILVNGDAFAVVRTRMEVDRLIGLERIPGWLPGAPGQTPAGGT